MIPIPATAHHPTVPPTMWRVDSETVDYRPRLMRGYRACRGPNQDSAQLGYSWLAAWVSGGPLLSLRTKDGAPLRCFRQVEEYEAAHAALQAIEIDNPEGMR